MIYEYPYDVKHDEEAAATYIKLSDQSQFKTITIGDRVMVDVDDQGEPVGIEILD